MDVSQQRSWTRMCIGRGGAMPTPLSAPETSRPPTGLAGRPPSVPTSCWVDTAHPAPTSWRRLWRDGGRDRQRPRNHAALGTQRRLLDRSSASATLARRDRTPTMVTDGLWRGGANDGPPWKSKGRVRGFADWLGEIRSAPVHGPRETGLRCQLDCPIRPIQGLQQDLKICREYEVPLVITLPWYCAGNS